MSASKHIIILVANAQGHIIPTLAFAKKLASHRKDLTITLVTTPLNAKFIRSKILSFSSDARQIHVAEIPFNSSDHGLPPNVENTDSVTVSQMQLLVAALVEMYNKNAKSVIASIIEKQDGRPLCLVYDLVIGQAVEVSRSLNIPAIGLNIISGFGALSLMLFWTHLPHRYPTESDEYTLPGVPERFRFKSSDLPPWVKEADGTDYTSIVYRHAASELMKADGILCNSVEEIEGLGLELLRKHAKKPVWAIGPLIPTTMLIDHDDPITYEQHGVKVYGVSPSKCVEWLDSKPQGSVVYISFGSQNTISTTQMWELANGLAESGHPFIWVLRPPLGFNKDEEFKPEWLPENFEEKVTKTNQGMLIYGWAPQPDILSHKSTGAFLTHCGWNSVLESLSQGVPIIGWPMADDQKYNFAYLKEEMGVPVKLAGGPMSVITGKVVSRVINDLMDESTGKRVLIKNKVDEVARKMRASVIDDGRKAKGSSLVALDDFIRFLEEKATTC